MKRIRFEFTIILICLLLFGASAIRAQSVSKQNEKLTAQITKLRQRLNDAIEKRDRKTLETLFADDFTHTHAVGRTDGKAARINSILSGGKTLETVEPDELSIRFYGKNTAVAIGQTTIDEMIYRWTVVYIKDKKGWQIAASQASEKK